ncbi:MAG: hypothetical protein COW24_02205 [Candidatus Kerfeldbacteria bacterium CG15_BIG_FIL_POST_REV_8_21_14_020_45_12]|uniref:Uncharacterized protein n=1 Tax=Candidatus Kerfeldbacteria bacterium CG15_BIG_FIL_POST_REV_8_21_14_020_45_12 TaxID=2014247 RepID=A0A2M7H4A3_9BACT|nr:MAG: hypothetical protein COW24_02205 [Candidatus Kerfeldbacteria bacterium CG15_BIG_FIL_POST_REV_8_21_14_020_45_12]PJA94054.1 MAG: hypothetical protein CO132_00280 [Candidatus Kerfeldbacteria bacterium CG_4_9_14_3_um_filter_45_8]
MHAIDSPAVDLVLARRSNGDDAGRSLVPGEDSTGEVTFSWEENQLEAGDDLLITLVLGLPEVFCEDWNVDRVVRLDRQGVFQQVLGVHLALATSLFRRIHEENLVERDFHIVVEAVYDQQTVLVAACDSQDKHQAQ